MFTKKDIEQMTDGARVEGYAAFQEIEEKTSKNGSPYLTGYIQCKGKVPYKVWSNSQCFLELKGNFDAYKGAVCEISGRVNVYEGTKSIIIETCCLPEGDNVPDPIELFESKYDEEKYFGILQSTIQKNCSEGATKVFNLILDKYIERFKVEFAALYHHDNCKSGLIAHTTKLVKMLSLLNMYPNVVQRCGGKDVLYVGAALHDIGKIFEYLNGSLSWYGRHVSHEMLGVIVVSGYENEITNLVGEDFYLTLLSIISQHSGQWGDKPRTVAAYIIHLLDMLESRLTDLNEKCEDSQRIDYDGFKLN